MRQALMGPICGLLHLFLMTRKVATPRSVPLNRRCNPALMSLRGWSEQRRNKQMNMRKKMAGNKQTRMLVLCRPTAQIHPSPSRLHNSHLSRTLICHCCFPFNILITLMFYAEKGEKSVIISGAERSRSPPSCFLRPRASSARASSPLTVLTSHHRRSRGQRQESASAAPTKTISCECSPSTERSACVPEVNTLCVPGKHTGHTTGDLLHFNCTSWDEEIKPNRFFFFF